MLVAIASYVASGSTQEGIGNLARTRLSADGHDALVWLRDSTPPDSIILANAYTEGSIGTIARRNGLLDGRAPYNKQFDFLLASVDQLRLGRSFYQGETGIESLVTLGVDYVVVIQDNFAIANSRTFCDPPAELDPRLPCFAVDPGQASGLVEVARFGSIAIYEAGTSG